MPPLEEEIAPQVRTMQFIVGAMIFTPVIFLAILFGTGDWNTGDPIPVLVKVALGFGLLSIVLQSVLGRKVGEQAALSLGERATEEPQRLAGAYLSGLIVSAAMNEGAAFFNLIVYAFEQSSVNLGMALLLIASNATKFPTVGRVAAWARAMVRRIEENRSLMR